MAANGHPFLEQQTSSKQGRCQWIGRDEVSLGTEAQVLRTVWVIPSDPYAFLVWSPERVRKIFFKEILTLGMW